MKKGNKINLLKCFVFSFFSVLVILNSTSYSQCTNQVFNLSGNTLINCVNVTVSSTGITDSYYNYCNSTVPYSVGRQFSPDNQGNGSFTFNFQPPITALTLNFSGITNITEENGLNLELVKLYVNGVHYAIPTVGTPNDCDSMATLTPYGDIIACGECPLAGWNGTTINGPIYSLTVVDTVLNGTPDGFQFSLFICDSYPDGCKVIVDMPNVFTPNNDGVNDTFYPIKTNGITQVFVNIFDRWGNNVFFSNSLNPGWDGKYNGKECIAGTYYWVIQYVDFFNNELTKRGYLSLIR